MPIVFARWISIVWHPLLVIAGSIFFASLMAGRLGSYGQQVWVFWPIAALLIAVAVFLLRQHRTGVWTHVDASQPAERRELNRFLLLGLLVATALAAATSAAPELTIALAIATSCMAVVNVSARWLKISQHCLFAMLPLAWLWPSRGAATLLITMGLLVAASRVQLKRHSVIEVLFGLALGTSAAFAAVWIAPSPTTFKPSMLRCGAAAEQVDNWAVQPASADLLASFCTAVQQQIDDGANLHAVLIEQGGRLRFEAYTRGVDRPINSLLPALQDFNATSRHDLRSISKSVLALLVLIAHSENSLPSLSAPVLAYFPEYADLRGGPPEQLTLVHLLNMSAGLAWDESGSYAALTNSETRMRLSRDPLRTVLTGEQLAAPGERFIYSGGNTALLAEILDRATGQSLATYAQTKLFAPLGIANAEWVVDRHGKALAYSGLRMSARDLARIGRLLLDGGRWQGRALLPADSVRALFASQIDVEDGLRYSHQWWLSPAAVTPRWIAAFGNGGQHLYLLPELDLSVVILAGDYNRPQQGRAARALLSAAVHLGQLTPRH